MNDQIDIIGYYPGVLGRITTLHATYYKAHWGLDHSFEAEVSQELGEFMAHFDPWMDGLWNAVAGEDFIGAIAIAGDRGTPGEARLRWYIVDPRFHGRGIGRDLIEKALAFSKKVGFDRISLWTFEGLERAQSIYQENGFRLVEIRKAEQWGGTINEQRFELRLR